MKKYFTIILLLFIFNTSFSQEIPDDRALLKILYGKVDKGGKSSTIEYENKDFKQSPNDSLTFSVIFKEYFNLNNSKTLYVICQAKSFYLQGHQFGFTQRFYLRIESNKWKIINKYVDDEPVPIGDDNEIKLITIGKNKSALISTFLSTGNQHVERSIFISYLSDAGLKSIGEIDLDYSNEAWVDFESAQDSIECDAFGYESKYEIIESSKEWFDIKVTKRIKTYTTGCKEAIIKAQEIIYCNSGTGYKELKK